MTRTRVIGMVLAVLLGSAGGVAAQATLTVPESGGTGSVTWTRGPYAATANPTPQAGRLPRKIGRASCRERV